MTIQELRILPREIRLAADTRSYEAEKEISALAKDKRRIVPMAKISATYIRTAHSILTDRLISERKKR